MVSMRRFRQIIFTLIIILITSNYGILTVHAQETSIRNLSFPTQRVTNTTAPVTFDLVFSSVSKGDRIFAEIADLDSKSPMYGTASSAPNACIPLVATLNNIADCVLSPSGSSGSEHVTFQLQISIRAHVYHLGVTTGALNSTNYVIGSSLSTEEFTFKGGSILTLRVNVVNPVNVTVDGIEQPAGSVAIDLQPGVHSISVPNVTMVDNSRRLVFGGWSDASTQLNRSEDLEGDTVLAAEFVNQYKLALNPVGATGGGWYYEGDRAQVSIPAQMTSTILDMLGAKSHFTGWFENGQLMIPSSTGSIQMNGAHTLTAEWTTDYTIPIVIVVTLLAIVVLGSGVVYRRTVRSKRK